MGEEISASTTAWEQLIDALRDAGRVVEGPLGATDGRERAEGYRHVLRVLSVAREMLLERADTAHPTFTRWMSPHRKIYGDNPGTIYDACLLDPSRTYVIRGRRGTETYLGFVVYGWTAEGNRTITSSLDGDDLPAAVDEDGDFEVWLSSEPPPGVEAGGTGSWLQLTEESSEVMVRQYFLRPDEQQPATYAIESPGAPPPAPPTDEQMAARLRHVASFVSDTVKVEATLSALMTQATPGVLRSGSEYLDAEGQRSDPPVDASVVAKMMPTPAIQYTGASFEDLGDDEVFVVEGTAPDARYWSVHLLNRWMESPDAALGDVVVSAGDADLDEHGRFRVVIAHEDPGTGDRWLPTTGLRNANVAVRSLLGTEPPQVEFRREPR